VRKPRLLHSKAKFAALVEIPQNRLGYSSQIALGDAVRAEIVRKAEHAAQHGACKTLFWSGNPVPLGWQSKSPDEVTRLMIQAGYKPARAATPMREWIAR